MKKVGLFLAVLALLVAPVNAQLASSIQPITINFTENAFASLSSPSSSFVIPSNGTLSNTVTFQVLYAVNPGWNGAFVYSWFSNPTQALTTSGGSAIPSSAISLTASSSTGQGTVSASPCNTSQGGAVGSVPNGSCPQLQIGSNGSPGNTVNPAAPIVVTMQLQLNTSANQYAAGSYNGTLNVVFYIA